MIKIISSPNCGNSPKMEFLKEFNILFAKGDIEILAESVIDDIIWDIIGDKTISGKKDYVTEITKMKNKKITELTLTQILSHGKEGAVNGVIKMEDGKRIAFSNFYLFQGAKGDKIKYITSYLINTN
ncbi:nuclear transport factor 2 family protein [Pedobacter namyangjuensis]|uniref:nuclear transport factor 2 family protein n=1 Tax=Pedobacter namyangjuensis TaxID=600626 RepID=UPI000DE3436A|nr:nuclear transport factor 2 family protein [Pedobacter namyangjuensis]